MDKTKGKNGEKGWSHALTQGFTQENKARKVVGGNADNLARSGCTKRSTVYKVSNNR